LDGFCEAKSAQKTTQKLNTPTSKKIQSWGV